MFSFLRDDQENIVKTVKTTCLGRVHVLQFMLFLVCKHGHLPECVSFVQFATLLVATMNAYRSTILIFLRIIKVRLEKPPCAYDYA